MENKLIYEELTYKIRGCLYKVHNELGRLCNEKQYGDALEGELKKEGIQHKREKILDKCFDVEKFGRNRVDFIVEDKIILELKTSNCLSKNDYFQCQRYLTSSGLRLALLVNFRSKRVVIKRVLNTKMYKNK
ncbi:MAG: GxxExxY protein [Candidatus Magasanikbacteria bacterium]|nr:GxxExxY protein [Candidatus Magasanikbacteria bacterium]